MTPPVRWRLRKAADGSWYFVQQAENNEVLATSEMYTRRESAEDGARAAGCPDDQWPLDYQEEDR